MARTDAPPITLRSQHRVLAAAAGVPVVAAARSLFAELASLLRADGVQSLQEKVYGPFAERERVLAIRRDALLRAGLDPELPCTYIAGRPHEDLGLAGLQLWGLVPASGASVQVRTVRGPGGFAGRLLEVPGARLLHLASIDGRAADGCLPRESASQAGQMLANTLACLAAHGFAFGQVARTWIYLPRLLDWYGEFNRVRTDFLRRHGLTGEAGGLPFPASTAIQGCGGAGECRMDLLAAAGDAVQLRPIDATARQQQPIVYGSSFSRGMVLSCGGEATVLVSGTASIDGAGRSRHRGQREAQVLETLLAVAGVLAEQGASLRDVVQATLFCKDRDTLAAFERTTHRLGIPRLPAVAVLADVCRPELLVEIEAVALVPRPPRPGAEARP